MNKFKRSYLVLIFILAILMIFTACSKDTEGLVGSVNGQDISQEEFDADFQVYRNDYIRQYGEDVLEDTDQAGVTVEESLKHDILEKLIMEKLIAKELEKQDVIVSDEEVNEAIEKSIGDMDLQEDFEDILADMNITREYYESYIKKILLAQKHKAAFLDTVDVTDEDAKAFFDESGDASTIIRASQIQVETEAEGKDIIERLENGEDFATLATLESRHSESAAKGGDLGYFGKGIMIAEFEEAVFNLEEGETSGVIKTEAGYHIIRVTEKKDSFEELKDEIVNLLKDNKYLEKVQDLRDDAKVEKYLD